MIRNPLPNNVAYQIQIFLNNLVKPDFKLWKQQN